MDKCIVFTGDGNGLFTKEITEQEDVVCITLEDCLNNKLEDISQYDVSENVNSFTYGGQQMWLDKNMRSYIRNGVSAYIAVGKETYPLWTDNMCIELPCATLVTMLDALEAYAVECYDVTARHKAEVSQLTSIEDIEAYDIEEGYPARLVF